MKHKILILLIMLSFVMNTNAFADNDIEGSRAELSSALNDTVKDLKQIYSDTETTLTSTKADAESLKVVADKLVKRSEKVEMNPSVLNHGESDIPTCSYNTHNLHWDGSSWKCRPMEVDSECQTAANDEYRYKDSNGNYVCSKTPKGQGIRYYWSFRGYSATCSNPSVGYNKLYSCNYKNKNSQIVQVGDGYCKSAKPSVAKKTCTTSWRVAGWGGCNKSCGGGTQTRSVTCPAGYACTGTRPISSQSCNTQSCPVPWSVGSWSSCKEKKVCYTNNSGSDNSNGTRCTSYGYQQTRSVYCRSGYTCVGSKPATLQKCSPPDKHCGRRCEG